MSQGAPRPPGLLLLLLTDAVFSLYRSRLYALVIVPVSPLSEDGYVNVDRLRLKSHLLKNQKQLCL